MKTLGNLHRLKSQYIIVMNDYPIFLTSFSTVNWTEFLCTIFTTILTSTRDLKHNIDNKSLLINTHFTPVTRFDLWSYS